MASPDRVNSRFTGEDVEPRSGISSGHIPNSYSLPFDLFLRYHKARDGEEYGTFLPTSDLRKLLDATIGSEESDKLFRGEGSVITSCGSGMTAAVLWLGLQLLGVPRVSLYDEVISFSLRYKCVLLMRFLNSPGRAMQCDLRAKSRRVPNVLAQNI